ncbi:DNA internalization-related competence protein ComEC/Rec2 [Vibrio sp. TRT 17S01]|uniref:DNA internalization-related competence protein ComEC/Rec2 n=1 Tax=Vibrio sp. TRT 17S01 TaxID=3418505 RepID=UPI003CEDDC3F
MVRSIEGEELSIFERPKIRLVSPIPLSLGEQISASIKIKHIYGRMNEVGFDNETFSLSRSVVAQGNVKRQDSLIVEQQLHWRQWLYSKVEREIAHLPSEGVIKALTFAERSDISRSVWEAFKASGLSHLIAISGLHIGIAFGLGWLIGFQLIRFHSVFTPLPVLSGLLFAFAYAWLAGFSIPTVRALLMCAMYVIMAQLNWRIPFTLKWLLCLAILLLFDPFSSVAASFWLSMLAVGVIFYFLMQTSTTENRCWQFIKAQCFLTVLMAPILVVFFQGVSVSGALFNLIFVPWFSFLVVPIAFLGLSWTLLSLPGVWLVWELLDGLLKPMLFAIEFADLSWWSISGEQRWLVIAFALYLMMFPLLSRYARLLIAIGIVLLNFKQDKNYLWQMDVVDVGHGLAIVIEQDEQAVIYDTGASWELGSMAENVIAPILTTRGITQLEGMILSHGDNDHSGGAPYLIKHWQPTWVRSSQNGAGQEPCSQGINWTWGELTFVAIWPPKQVSRPYNPHSCVVRVTHQRSSQSVLLTGDIDQIAEWLLLRQPEVLPSDIVIVPHHGSKTSSTPRFVELVDADLAIASLAKGGRWKLPHSDVVRRYQDNGTQWMDTGESGQVSVYFYENKWRVEGIRQRRGQTWYRQMLRNQVE